MLLTAGPKLCSRSVKPSVYILLQGDRGDEGAHTVLFSTHCNENLIYVFPEKELRGLSPNFHIRVSVSDLYIPRIVPHIFLQQNRQTDQRNI
jgi:hypothetical protein